MTRALCSEIIAIVTALILAGGAPAHAQSPTEAQPPSATNPPSKSTQPLTRESTTFDLVVKLPFAETERLFGPEGERTWAGVSWNPEFLFPQPAHDEAGAIFWIDRGPYRSVWVVTQFDSEAGHYQFVYQMQSLLVTTIDVRFKAIDSGKTAVNVAYVRTAMVPEANERVATMSSSDRAAGPEWQHAIDTYLDGRTARTKP